jgi:recombination protein RecR
MKLPKALEKVIENFERLPGIGPKSAQRLAFYLLHVPQSDIEQFADNLKNLKEQTVLCSICFNIGEGDPCWVCQDIGRDESILCVVEDALDLLAIEKSGKYKGLYHVLHGVIDPLNSIGPDDIYIPQLIKRIRDDNSKITEIILATNPTMEGEATSLFISKEIVKSGLDTLKITRIGRGLPTGADLEYADDVTIERALEGRREF